MFGNSISFQDYPLEDAIRVMREVGFDGVDMWRPHFQRCKTAELRRQFVKYANEIGMAMGGLIVVGEPYYKPFGTDEELQATLDGLKADMEIAASMGMHDMLIWEGVRPKGMTDQQCMERLLPRLVELFRPAVAFGASLKCRILAEPHPHTVGMIDALLTKLYDTLDSQYFGISYDCCHYGVGRPKDYVAVIQTLGPRIRHIDYSDSDQISPELHMGLGMGCLDLDAMLKAFKAIRFDGTLSFDLCWNPMPVYSARQSMSRLRQAYDFLGLPS